ncbi:MAG: ATPase domain-containing protein [Candidatus Nitrosocaldus sp.]
MEMISTGSRALDALLLGGVRRGLLYSIFGASGSGKTQLCIQLALNSARTNDRARVMIIDAKGDFRPERMLEMVKATIDEGDNYSNTCTGSNRGDGGESRDGAVVYDPDDVTLSTIMDRVYVKRVYNTDDVFNSLMDVDNMYNRYGLCLLVVEDSPSLFRLEYGSKSVEGHFRLMRLMHDLALRAVLRNTAIIVTNGVTSSIRYEHNYYATARVGAPGSETEGGREERQIMDRSVSMFTHFKVRLERLSLSKNACIGVGKEKKDGLEKVFKATLLQPVSRDNIAHFSIVKRGIVDI